MSAFGALSGLTGSLRDQLKSGGDGKHELRLDSKAAESLLKILEKYEASQAPSEA